MKRYVFESGKATGDSIFPYKNQLIVLVKKENILSLIKNIADSANNSDDETIQIGFAGEME